MKHRKTSSCLFLACAALLGVQLTAFARPQTTTPLVLGPNGAALNFGTTTSYSPIHSADGRFVVFCSASDHVVPQLANPFGGPQAYLLDTVTGVTTLVSATAAGTPCQGGCNDVAISADGSTIAFVSDTTDLSNPPTTGWRNVYSYDVATRVLTLESVGFNGGFATADSHDPVLSGDGRLLAFSSFAGNVVSGDTNGLQDVFLRDRALGTTEWISAPRVGGTAGDAASATLSADGRYLAFASSASDLVPNDAPSTFDIFLLDRSLNLLRAVSTTPGGALANGPSLLPRLSVNGQWLVFQSMASDIVPGFANGVSNVFVHSLVGMVTFQVSRTLQFSPPNGASQMGYPSPDGRWIVYTSAATDIVAGDSNGQSDVFLLDMLSGRTELVSVSTAGAQGNSFSGWPQVDSTGARIYFQSNSTTLGGPIVPGTSNIFVRDRGCVVTRYCSASPSSAGCSAAILGSGTPSATPGSSFHISATELPRERNAALVWGFAPTGLPFAGGLLCVAAPLHRTRASFTGGNAGPACGGTFDFDFSASYIGAQALAPGMSIFCQVFCRDVSGPNLALSDALNFVICP